MGFWANKEQNTKQKGTETCYLESGRGRSEATGIEQFVAQSHMKSDSNPCSRYWRALRNSCPDPWADQEGAQGISVDGTHAWFVAIVALSNFFLRSHQIAIDKSSNPLLWRTTREGGFGPQLLRFTRFFGEISTRRDPALRIVYDATDSRCGVAVNRSEF